MRDAALLIVFAALFVLALRRSYNAYLLWGWAGLMAIDSYVYGFMQELRPALVFAVLIPLSFVWNREPKDYRFGRGLLPALLVLFALHGLVSVTLGYPGIDRSWEIYTNLLKALLFCLLMPILVRSRLRFVAMIACICLATAFHGVLDGLKYISTAGGHFVRGLPKYGDNNHLALIWVMTLPLLIFVARRMPTLQLRFAIYGAAAVLAIGVLATYSRGGLISLGALAVWHLWTGRRKLLTAAAIGAVAVLLPFVTSDRWEERMDTITAARQDESFLQRVVAWQVSSSIALAHPLFGGGFRAVQDVGVWVRHFEGPTLVPGTDLPLRDTMRTAARAAHSIYFEVLGDQGFPGLALFLAVIAAGLRYALRLMRLPPIENDDRWAREYGLAAGASLFVYVVGGAALSAAYFELPYYIAMSTLVALRLAEQDLNRATGGTGLQPKLSSR